MSILWADQSGTIPAGGTVAALGPDINRRGVFFMNTSVHGQTVTVGSTPIPVGSGAILTLPIGGTDAKWCPSNAISISGTAGDTFSISHW